jgi:hypothetical protein
MPAGIRTKEGDDVPLDIIVVAAGYFAYPKKAKMLSFQFYG